MKKAEGGNGGDGRGKEGKEQSEWEMKNSGDS